jgi:hypothetical protein
MKYLKTFESYSINEEEELFDKSKKFFTGHEGKEAKEKAKADFHKALDEAEELVAENPEGYVFNRESLEKKAEENNYKGGLRVQRGGRDTSRVYIVYDTGISGFQKLASLAANKRDNPLN